MTIIIGVLCKDGVVIGTDSAATLGFPTGAGKMATIEQPCHKIDVIGGRIILAGTGQVGYGQRFVEDVKKLSLGEFSKKSPVEIGKMLSKAGIDDFASTQGSKGEYGALVAFPADGAAHICELAIKDFQPELKDEKIWFVSMGSGQAIADTFLALMRSVFWPNSNPTTCEDGIFLVHWALRHAIDVNPGGINAPACIAILIKGKKPNEFEARMLSEEDLRESEGNIDGAISSLRAYASAQSGQGEAPEVPKVKEALSK